jgi:hypothetical protein
MILFRGTTSLRAALLVFWVVPLPSMIIGVLGGEAAIRSIYAAGAALLEPLGMVFEFGPRVVSAGANELPLAPHQSGLLLATHMAGLAWYSAQRRGLARSSTARLLVVYALLALPIQFAAIVTNLMLLYWGSPGWMVRVVDTAIWLLPCLVVVYREEIERQGRA